MGDLFFIRFDALSLFRASQFRPDVYDPNDPLEGHAFGSLKICGRWCDIKYVNRGVCVIAILIFLFGITINLWLKVGTADLIWINGILAGVLLCLGSVCCYGNWKQHKETDRFFTSEQHTSKGPHEVE